MDLTASEQRFVQYYKGISTITELEEIKLAYGYRVVMREVKKLVIVYSIALLLGIFLELLVLQIGFLVFRQVSYGLHCSSFKSCIVFSSIIFPSLTWFTINTSFSTVTIWILYACALALLCLMGPISSQKTAVRGEAHRRFLRKKMYKRMVSLTVLLVLLPQSIAILLIAGVLMETVLVSLSWLNIKEEF
ncbi:accessory gene regulator B family protein [Bacillus cereus]|nr:MULTISPECIES: accessory gene regulator B family protein [Bacillus cereus group]MDA1536817.1 accessory gene regulator B family protein [Bacillus cereus group sp. TH254-2LC]MDA1547325.1 accessory gene regulator B family protein [Bacillus cereus group sp. TH253LC]MDA1581479.1 accessory gene regulator B family protein [Bacillus cereus group sp. TH228LC]MDA1631011.1 accessory gene regulator B family protein [Bacillus cereus group sp. TH172LC]MDA1839729.1 accessory gene regulator B family protein